MEGDVLAGRLAAITGGGRGFGRAVATAFAHAGADLVLMARSSDELTAVRDDLATRFPLRRIEIETGDVSLEADVARFAARAHAAGGADVVVCNAGIHGPIGPVESGETSPARWMEALAVNIGGTFLCARAFADQLKKSSRGKLIVLSGGGATKPMANMSAYSASKAGLVRLAETIATEWVEFGIDVNAVAPGAMNTRMLDDALAAGPERLGPKEYASLLEQQRTGGAPPARGADLCTFLASRRSDGITGRLISAIWDPWERLAPLAEDLRTTDIYTLRRIVPEDRGRTW